MTQCMVNLTSLFVKSTKADQILGHFDQELGPYTG